MIGVSSAGRSFRAIATYLVAGRTGHARDRAAWSAGRNLPTDDPELAGVCMRATAARNGRVERPVYHLALSFDPTDGVDRATMEAVADRVLARLGLAEHQAVLVAHNDRAHAHVHVLVNRVHPETGRVAARDFDYRAVQEVLRAEERQLGLREVPGTLVSTPARETRIREPRVREPRVREPERVGPTRIVDTDDTDTVARTDRRPEYRAHTAPGDGATRSPSDLMRPPAESTLPRGVRRAAERAGSRPFVEEVRAQLPALRAADSWDAFERALAQHGWRVERQRTGLVVTDGTRYMRASRVAPDCSMPALARRFGASFDDHAARHSAALVAAHPDRTVTGRSAATAAPVRGTAPAPETADDAPHRSISRTTRYVAALLGEYDRAVRLEHLVGAARGLVSRAEARVRACEAAARDHAAADAAFGRSLSSVYRDPDAARRAFDTHRATRGAHEATRLLAERPEAFGALATVARGSRFGFGRREDETPAREAARVAARRATTREAAREWLASDAHTTAAAHGLTAARDRTERLRAASRAAPDRADLATRIARGISRLSEGERGELASRVTPRQAALAGVVADTLDERGRQARGQALGRTRVAPNGSDGARARHAEATHVGRLLHRAVAQLAPREYRELRQLVTAVRHPGLAVGQALRRAVRDALLDRDSAER